MKKTSIGLLIGLCLTNMTYASIDPFPHHGQYSALHAKQNKHSTLSLINRNNIDKMAEVWSMPTGNLAGDGGSPIIIDGMMYVHSVYPRRVLAVDLAQQGQIVWSYMPKEQDLIKDKQVSLHTQGIMYTSQCILCPELQGGICTSY